MSGKLSAREKNLSVLVGTIALLVVTYLIGDYFLKSRARLDATLVTQTRKLAMIEKLNAEKILWEKRDAWVRENQPKLANEDGAGVQLLDLVKELAKKRTVLLENPVIRQPSRKPDYTAVAVEIQLKCSWSSLVGFLGEIQAPERFIVLESVNLKVDPADPTQMFGRLKIARWYAPK
ncbi:MAG: GspMb/PilO family protein [Verrucomicrobia bacterium]|jgi:hypothetical protein|nr:GspMb/PilO family protein [Verrucomicrobiota bacterium]